MRQILYSSFLITALAFGWRRQDASFLQLRLSGSAGHQVRDHCRGARLRRPVEQNLSRRFQQEIRSGGSRHLSQGRRHRYRRHGFRSAASPTPKATPIPRRRSRDLWRSHTNSASRHARNRPHVTTETGVIVGNGTDPATGRRTNSVGTYEGVGVSNYPTQSAPSVDPPLERDADRMEAQLEKWALPEGKTASPIAGYVYFPVSAKKSKGALELHYSHDESSAT